MNTFRQNVNTLMNIWKHICNQRSVSARILFFYGTIMNIINNDFPDTWQNKSSQIPQGIAPTIQAVTFRCAWRGGERMGHTKQASNKQKNKILKIHLPKIQGLGFRAEEPHGRALATPSSKYGVLLKHASRIFWFWYGKYTLPSSPCSLWFREGLSNPYKRIAFMKAWSHFIL